MSLDNISCQKSFGGWHKRYRHPSKVLGCDMVFAVYLPPQAEQGEKLPVLYWLSGLTCTDENFMQKAGAQRLAAELGLIIVAPDTSPRGEQVPGDPEGAWDFGLGAGFYLNATQQPWAQHYRMHDYVVHELPALVEAHFPASDQRSISGHSMGGHGALTIALKHPDRFRSASAFAPIVEPSTADWSIGAFEKYLGPDRNDWRKYDAVALVEDGMTFPELLIDQGLADNFLQTGLRPWLLEEAAEDKDIRITMRDHERYDHSYYFISTFMDDHLRWHAERLK